MLPSYFAATLGYALPARTPLVASPRACAALVASPRACAAMRIKNAASEGAEGWNANPSLQPPKKTIKKDEPDLTSPTQTYAALCKMCGTSEKNVDFDGFVPKEWP